MGTEYLRLRKKSSYEQSSSIKPMTFNKTDSGETYAPQSPITQLQRNLGNQAMQRMCKTDVIQAKLKVGQPNDIYEQEADHVADQVMRIPDSEVSGISKAPINIQRKCATCTSGHGLSEFVEEEEGIQRKPLAPTITPLIHRQESFEEEEDEELIQAKKAEGLTPEVTSAISSGIQSLQGGGRPLSESERSFFEPRVGADFSNVRVHCDTRAASVARSVNARAFTLGRDVVFGAGEHSLNTSSGRKLLAHELTHVVQQRGKTSRTQLDGKVQRVPSDFHVLGQEFHDSATIYFSRNSTSLDQAARYEVASMVNSHGVSTNLTLNGFQSEEETPPTLAIARYNAVESEMTTNRSASADPLEKHPAHTGTRAKVDMASASAGVLDYKAYRKVEVLATPSGLGSAPSPTPSVCVSPIVCASMTDYDSAVTTGHGWLTTAITAVNAYNGTTQGHVSRFFNQGNPAPANAKTDILSRLNRLNTHLPSLRPQVECALACDSECIGSNAKNYGTGIRLAGSPLGTNPRMLLCQGFFSKGPTAQAEKILHEALHGLTGGLKTTDHAYDHQRLIEILPYSQAEENTDSYVVLIRFLNGATPAVGVSGDVRSGMSGAEESKARRALAYMETWLISSYQLVKNMYGSITSARSAGAWPTSKGFNRNTMHEIATLFSLTDPGAHGDAYTLVTADDQYKTAAIFDRYYTMRSVMLSDPVTLSKVSGAASWAAGPGSSANLDITFFALSNDTARTRYMLLLLVTATPNISTGLHDNYVDGANILRQRRYRGP